MNVNILEAIKNNVDRRYIKYTKDDIESISKLPHTVVGDSLVPSCFVQGIPVPTNAIFISESIASLVNGDTVPFDVLLSMLDIKISAVKKALKALKEEKINLVLIGYGGYSINTLEFLYQFCIRCGITDLFNHISIFENDNITFTNTLRLYKSLNYMAPIDNAPHKFNLIKNPYDGVLSSDINCVYQEFNQDVYEKFYKDKNVVYLGAPDFNTRIMLKDERFIFGGHAGDEVALISRPLISADLTTESYGTINPVTLLMNLIKAAAALPDALLLKEFPENEILFEYNFKTAVQNKEVKSKLDWLFREQEVNCQSIDSTEASEVSETTEPSTENN